MYSVIKSVIAAVAVCGLVNLKGTVETYIDKHRADALPTEPQGL